MKDCVKSYPLAPVTTSTLSKSFPRHASSSSTPRRAKPAFIYVVDDEEGLTLLYTHFLNAAGYIVHGFGHRAEALAALKAASTKPDLLITDYFGLSMPADWFMERCRKVHPPLRILMASGLNESDARFPGVRPDHFIQKPFTLDHLQHAVETALTAL